MLIVGKLPKNRKILHIFNEGLELKKCSTCNDWKGVCNFYKSSKNWDCLSKICKHCYSIDYIKNKDRKNKLRLEYQRKNKDRINSKRREKRLKSGESVREYFRKYHVIRKSQDPLYHFSKNVRRLVQHAFNGFAGKRSKTKTILGVNSWDFFYNYLLETFKENYGRNLDFEKDCFHIDHKIPISSAKSFEDVVRLNHYTNLQLLLAKDNMAKSNQLDWTL